MPHNESIVRSPFSKIALQSLNTGNDMVHDFGLQKITDRC